MQKFQDFARHVEDALPAPEATIGVYDLGTDDLSTIYSDNLPVPTPKANPFTADVATGYFFFYAADGRYDIRVSGQDSDGVLVTTYTLSDVLLDDPA